MRASTPTTPHAQAVPVRFQRPRPPALAAVARYYAAAEEARWFSNFGPCHELLVERLEAAIGQGVHVLPVANCTLGLMVALRGLAGEPDGRRDLVVTPSYTFAAAGSAITWAGFRPLFVDVDPDAWLLDPEQLAGALRAHGGRVAAVMAASTFGTPPPAATTAAWEQLCAAAGVPLLVDSAAGFGARHGDGRWLGAQGDAEVFSFHATKPFSVGEAGLVATRDPGLRDRLRRLVNFGFDAERVVSGDIGLNAKLAELPAAAALAVLDGYDDVLAARRASAAHLRDALEPFGFRFQAGCEGSTWQAVSVQAPRGIGRAQLLERAAALGVEVRAYFDVPVHRMGAFSRDARVGELPVTTRLAERAVSLPMADDLGPAELQRIVLVAAG
jgi:dTDP-4-amino-4,6-dideoxygalactose transaminase